MLEDNHQVRLNIGCGIFYKPGYINIDNFDNSIGDETSDAENLNYKENSVDLIESFHLIEHFDYINCKYVLSEWFRILKPNGKLIVETPDLVKSLKKFQNVDLETKKRTLNWIFGIDNQGMSHKTGFTFKLLKELLEEIGFNEISNNKPVSHTYEPGLRIECTKPKNFINYQFISIFQKEVKNRLRINESNLLISLDDYCISQIRKIYLEGFEKNKKKAIRKIISKSAISNPLISLIFCEKCFEFNLFTKKELQKELEIIKKLIDIEYHKKLLSLWKKSKKETGQTNNNFLDFLKHQESKLLKIFENYNDDELNYLLKIKNEEIKLFNFHVVQHKAIILSNKGIKEFSKKNYKKAIEYFLDSISLFPNNAVPFWNLARLGIITKNNKNNISEYYNQSLALIKDNKNKIILKSELTNFKRNNLNLNSKYPICGYLR